MMDSNLVKMPTKEERLMRRYEDVLPFLYYYRATFDGNYDGDSLDLKVDVGYGMWKDPGKENWVRLHWIDTPEVRGEERVLGLKVKKILNEMLIGKPILVDSVKKGKFGRWLSLLYVPGLEVSVNQWLMDEGHADPYDGGRR